MTDAQALALYHAAEAYLDTLYDALDIGNVKLRLAAASNDGPPEPTDGSGPFGKVGITVVDLNTPRVQRSPEHDTPGYTAYLYTPR